MAVPLLDPVAHHEPLHTKEYGFHLSKCFTLKPFFLFQR